MSLLTNTAAGLGRAWYAVAMSSEVGAEPLAVELLGRPWVVVRLGGKLAAFEDRCPHRHAPLSLGTACGATWQCGYHGWRFAGDGSCVAIPSLGESATIPPRARVAVPAGLCERYGLVWLAPDPPVADLPSFGEWDDPAYDRHWNQPRRTPTGAFQLTDNFLDATHLPWVHTATFGVADAGALPDFRVEGDGWRIWTTYRVLYRNYDDPLVASGQHPLVQPQDLYKEAVATTTALIRLDFPLTGRRLAILFACLPENDRSTRIFKQMARNDFSGDRTRLAEAERFEDLVLDEDLVVLERYRTMGLPLDLRDEVHTRSDKLAVAYRRLLRTLVSGDGAPTWRTGEEEAEAAGPSPA